MRRASLKDILAAVNARHAPVLSLLELYHGKVYDALWDDNVTLYQVFARRLVEQGNPGPALELIREGLDGTHAGDAGLLYLEALALSRGGNIERTEELLGHLLRRDDLELKLQIEALSLDGRTWKDRYLRARKPAERRNFAAYSAERYERAFLLEENSFAGSNAATMARLSDDGKRSRSLARKARDCALKEIAGANGHPHYWVYASLGEAQVHLDDFQAAHENYEHAVTLAGKDYGSIARMRQQLLMLREVEPRVEPLLELFRLGAVVAFAGHRIDPPTEAKAGLVRFPNSPALEEKVRAAIKAKLNELDPIAGYVAPSCGADLLFAELMLERGRELHVVLPFHKDDFFKVRVDYGQDNMQSWRGRCQSVLDRKEVAVHFAIQEEFLEDHVLFDFANEFMQGLALARARQVGTQAHALLVLDREIGADSGTALFEENWKKASRSEPLVIDLAPLRRAANHVAPVGKPVIPTTPAERKREVRAMLFADVKNFSKLPDRKAPHFFLEFLNQVQGVVTAGTVPPLFTNTWGDGLYVVMPDVRSAADFALRLLDKLNRLNWKKLGLPKDTGVRVGLHTGPVFTGLDPVIGRHNFFGSHVSRAARIEPVTVPGCAFTSEQFAACLTVEAPDEYVCEFLGEHELAKKFDRCPLYRLLRRDHVLL